MELLGIECGSLLADGGIQCFLFPFLVAVIAIAVSSREKRRPAEPPGPAFPRPRPPGSLGGADPGSRFLQCPRPQCAAVNPPQALYCRLCGAVLRV